MVRLTAALFAALLLTTAASAQRPPAGPGSVGTAGGGGGTLSLSGATDDLVLTPDPITGTGTIGTTSPSIDLSGANAPFVTAYAAYLIRTGAHTYTLAQAGSAGFADGWSACILNIAGSGNSTINTTTSVFKGAGGATSLTLVPGAWACPSSDGTDWDTLSGGVIAASGTPASPATSLQYNNSGVFGGTTFNFVSDQIVATAVTPGVPSIVGIDAASGFGFNVAGEPNLSVFNNATLQVSTTTTAMGGGGPGVQILGSPFSHSFPFLGLTPPTGVTGAAGVELDGYSFIPIITLVSAGGVAGAPTPVVDGAVLGQIFFGGWDGFNPLDGGVQLEAAAAENFSGGHNGSVFRIYTASIADPSLASRLIIDGSGDINILNGGLVVGTPTDGSQGAGTVSTQNAVYTGAGLFNVVNTAPSVASGQVWIGVVQGSSGAGFCSYEMVTSTNTQVFVANVPGGGC